MIILGASTIKSFAITLLIGILLSMFTAIIVTRLLFNISLSFNEDSDMYYSLKLKKSNDDKDGARALNPSKVGAAQGEVE